VCFVVAELKMAIKCGSDGFKTYLHVVATQNKTATDAGYRY